MSTATAFLVTLAGAGSKPDWAEKVEPALLQQIALSNKEFLVVFSEQADLSGAKSLGSKRQKGVYVFKRLTEVAERTQAPLVNLLKARGVEYRSLWIANMVWIRGDAELLQAVAKRPEVARIRTDAKGSMWPPVTSPAIGVAQDSLGWNLVMVRAPEVWAMGYTGQGVVIGGQDTGYQWDHPALIHSYRGWDGTNADHNYNWHDAIHPSAFANACGFDLKVPCDDYKHGTATMGLMVGDNDGLGNPIGMAPGAKWIGARNMNNNVGSVASYTECFQWFLAPTDLDGNNPAPDRAPDVINNSWGCEQSEGCLDPLILKAAVESVRAAGIVVVAAAGNDGPDCSTIYAPPAIYDASLTVGASDKEDRVLIFSSVGPVVVDGSKRLKPNVCAPGGGWTSLPVNTYGSPGGTSEAAAHVSGLVALLLSAHPELKGQVEATERLIERTAVAPTNFTGEVCGGLAYTNVPNNLFGWGRIDALAALALDDSDFDGIPDWWMLAHFGHATGMKSDLSRAGDDPDGDGASNFEEYVAGTDPLDASSYFYLSPRLVNSKCTISFPSTVSRLYTLFRQVELGPRRWLEVTGQVDVPGTGETLELSDNNACSQSRFYRVRVRVAGSSGR
jgi:subtilisin family serine protease